MAFVMLMLLTVAPLGRVRLITFRPFLVSVMLIVPPLELTAVAPDRAVRLVEAWNGFAYTPGGRFSTPLETSCAHWPWIAVRLPAGAWTWPIALPAPGFAAFVTLTP